MAQESNTEVFVYTEGAVVPDDVVRVRVHPSVTVIPENAFYRRDYLEELELCEGLLEIGRNAFECVAIKQLSIPCTVTVIRSNAFYHCKQLKELELREGLLEIEDEAFLCVRPMRRLTIPNTVRSIGTLAFCHASCRLQHLQLPEGIENMGKYTFSHNRCPTLRIPPSLTRITCSFLGRCLSMFSIELSEGITIVERTAIQQSHSLRNIAFPHDVFIDNENAYIEEIADKVFDRCTDLQQLYETDQQLVNSLKHRFDSLPIHKMIYYQSYNNVTVDQLNEATSIKISQRRSKINPSGSEQDCLGMTPLHIMACSTVQNIELYKALIDKYPETLITEDRWQAIPLLYAVWGDAPDEIVQYLVESYKSIHPNYELNWNKMAESLCLGHAATSSIQMLLDVQDSPRQNVDWHTIIQKAATNQTPIVQADVFEFLAKHSYSKRIDTIGMKQWRNDLTSDIEEHVLIENGTIDKPKSYILSRDLPNRQGWLDGFNSKLSNYEARYQELKEATTVIELVLWKNKISEAGKSIDEEVGSGKKMKLDESAIRKQCRFSCGADIVIEHILPYLY